jgi:FkbM family methyltransferase
MKTKYKIFNAKKISFLITIFISKKQQTIRNNINWELDLNEGIDLSIFLFGTSERKILNLKNIFRSNSKLLFLDIGANVGSVSLPLAKLFKYCKIYSIEPTNFAFNKFKNNLFLNKDLRKRVFLNQFFVSNLKKPKKVWSSWSLDSNKKEHKKHKGKLKSIKKNSYISLDNFIKNKKIKKIDFIKLDVDGYELDVFNSGKKFFKKNKPIIFIEIAPYLYPEFGYSYLDLITYIRDIGYDFFDEDLKKIENIEKVVKKISNGSSKNFYLR